MPLDPSNLPRSGALSRALRGRAREEVNWRERVDDVIVARSWVGVAIAFAFAVLASALALWTHGKPLVAVGRVMDETRIVRVRLELEDREQTEQHRQAAKQATPRVYTAIEPAIEGVRTSLENLPRALASVEDVKGVDPEIQKEFQLTPGSLAAVRGEATQGEPSQAWLNRVRSLVRVLQRRPILDAATWQQSVQQGTHTTIRLIVGKEELEPVLRREVINAEDPRLAEAMTTIARDAGFTGDLRELVVRRLTSNPSPTYRFDAAATAEAQNAAADAVLPAFQVSPPGQTIFQRGERLTQDQYELYKAELARVNETSESWRLGLRRLAVIGTVLAITFGLAGYTVLFVPRIRASAARMLSLSGILLSALGVACVATAQAPDVKAVTTVIPTVVVALVVAIGYDRRSALAYALLQGLLACVALREDLGTIVTMVTGIACVVTMLRDIRDRNSLLRISVVTALGLATATIVTSLIERPILNSVAGSDPRIDTGFVVLRETIRDAGLVAGATLAVGGLLFFVLSRVERAFGVTTGLTLIELRDPKQPLLRELQLRAPGTYNHALNVASIVEPAAEAIGGNGLLAYVGALYHDVGKMIKPEYFVENQSGGPNRHDKLSPAMSLLVVVGHVKDGMELAREYGIPRNIQHFIESHHGTTLVEFFYHRAKKQAEGKDEDDGQVPDEIEYRYPGPKPATKEAAVLMIADAVESATRAMSDPTPARIDALVRQIANKRLLDGQFDDCELTLRELTQIVESISRTVASMYHGRISYPAGEQDDDAKLKTSEFTKTQTGIETKRA